ncbi:MAG: integrin alpha [Wenzhouxiangella sp.]|nr:integrin alpha [Wenzhouxiangella sp.]
MALPTAQAADVIPLSSLDGNNGFRLDGAAAGEISGGAVSNAGDINGDGIDDLIIGASAASPNGAVRAGSSYVVFGRKNGFDATINLSTLDGNSGFRLDGVSANDSSGAAVSSAGDINGDGVADLIIGARFADPGGLVSAGSSYVVFGRSAQIFRDRFEESSPE